MEREVHINAIISSFQRNEGHLKIGYFDELVEEGEVTLAGPRSVPLPHKRTSRAKSST